MHVRSSRPLLALCCLCALAAGCNGGRSPDFSIYDINGAAGYGHRTTVQDGKVDVVLTSDYGDPDRVVWMRRISKSESAFLAERQDRALRNTASDRYAANTCDGLQLDFTLGLSQPEPRKITVANRFVPALADLADALDAVLPAQYRIRYGLWHWEETANRDDSDSPEEE